MSKGRLEDSDKAIIQGDFNGLHKTAVEFANKLEGGDDKEIGIGLLHAWVKDLLGQRCELINILINMLWQVQTLPPVSYFKINVD